MNFISEIRKIPLFRIIIPIILGIILNIATSFEIQHLLAYIFVATACAVIFSNIDIKQKEVLFGISLYFTLFACGFGLVNIHTKKSDERIFNKKNTYIGEIINDTKVSEKTVKTNLQLKFFRNYNELEQIDEQTIVYLPIDTNSLQLGVGNWIVFSTNFDEIKNLGNPQEFDYKQYLSHKQIHSQAFIKDGN